MSDNYEASTAEHRQTYLELRERERHLYARLGEAVYEDVARSLELRAGCKGLLDGIVACERGMARLAARHDASEPDLCPRCGATVPAGSNFCMSCGADLRERQSAEGVPSGGHRTCPNCGAAVEPGAAFCGMCGHRL